MEVFGPGKGSLKFLRILAIEVTIGGSQRDIVYPIGTFVGHFQHGFRTDIVGPVRFLVCFGIRKVSFHPQFVVEAVADVECTGKTVHVGPYGSSVLVGVRKTETIGGFFTSAAHRKVVVRCISILYYRGQPVGVGVVFVEITPFLVKVNFRRIVQQLQQSGTGRNAFGIGRIPDGIFDKRHVFLTVEHRNRFRLEFGRELRRQSETRFAFRSCFGRYQQYTAGARCAVNGRGGGVFQYFYAFDVVRRQVQHGSVVFVTGRSKIEGIVNVGRIGDTVDHNQRVCTGIECGCTANANGIPGSRIASGQNIHTGQTAL